MHAALAAKLPCRMEEEAAFKAFAAQPNLHEQIFDKVAPNIFGHADIKKAVACLLFGGARKVRSCLLSCGLSRGPWQCTGGRLIAAIALLVQCSSTVFLFPASSPLLLTASTGHAMKLTDAAGHFTAHATAPSWVQSVAHLRSTSQKLFHSHSASLLGPHCTNILLLCKSTWCVCSSIKDCMSAEDARWNGTARGHQCAPHGRPLNRKVPVPQVCSQDCKPLALCSLCTCGMFCLLGHASGQTLCMRIWSCASVGNIDKSKSSLS